MAAKSGVGGKPITRGTCVLLVGSGVISGVMRRLFEMFLRFQNWSGGGGAGDQLYILGR